MSVLLGMYDVTSCPSGRSPSREGCLSSGGRGLLPGGVLPSEGGLLQSEEGSPSRRGRDLPAEEAE